MNTTTISNTDKNFVIITYDIVKNKHRNRVMKVLKGIGFHVQKSVFECFLNDCQLDALKIRLSSEIDDRYDGIRFYKLHGAAAAEVDIVGVGEVAENQQLIII